MLRNIKTTGSYSQDVVQEVAEGEETPLIKKNNFSPDSRSFAWKPATKMSAQPLFPYPEGSVTT